QAVYAREIRLWKRFEVVSSIETWEGTQVLGHHRYVLEDGRTAALILTTGGLYQSTARRFVPIDEVVSQLGLDIEPRAPIAEERSFMASHQGMRAMAKRPDSDLSDTAPSA